jgi:zinc/manganese transport system substrate-binding protein
MIVRAILSAFFLLVAAWPAAAKVNVAATLPWIGSLAGEIGGEKVRVVTLVNGGQGESKPSMILKVRRADLLIYNGLDLEGHYLPLVIESSRNPKVQPGASGNLDCSRFVEVLFQSEGHPHFYHLSLRNIRRVAQGIAEGLSRVDPRNASAYWANLAAFQEKLRHREKQWLNLALKGKRVLAYHNGLEYLAEEFGFEIVGYIEPGPGVVPTDGHMDWVVEVIKRTKPFALLATNESGEEEVQVLSRKTGMKAVVIPVDIWATQECRDWCSLIDQVLAGLDSR